VVLLNDFINAYIEAMLKSSSNENDEFLDSDYSLDNISYSALKSIEQDCTTFIALASPFLAEENLLSRFGLEEKAGRDFWLTRCGHGSGFWDGDWTEPAATVLTEIAHAFGNLDPYVGDDNKIYI
jgi:hypothetical protein